MDDKTGGLAETDCDVMCRNRRLGSQLGGGVPLGDASFGDGVLTRYVVLAMLGMVAGAGETEDAGCWKRSDDYMYVALGGGWCWGP